MQKIKRTVFLAAIAAVNFVAFAPSAHAGYYVAKKIYGPDGTLLGEQCEYCYFWDCNCN